jgi:LmbE family N-acetylglucosaminyl deacetylase
MKTMVIAAHPDDEILGCGGTMAKMTREDKEVYISILGEGITSRYENRAGTNQDEINKLKSASLRAAELVGVKKVTFHGLPDNRFDTVPFLDIVKLIEADIAGLKPQVIFTQHGGDLNIDHGITFKATMTATRPVCSNSVKHLYAYEVPSSTEWSFQQVYPPFKPNLFVDISSTIETKIQAMKEYHDEIQTFPHPRSPEALEAIAKRWGSAVGVGAAEAFEIIRSIK